MMTKNQFLLASACLFSVAMLGGCAGSSNVAENSDQATPSEATAETTPTEVIESAVSESTAGTVDPIAMTAIESPPAIEVETVATQAVITTTATGVVIIPLGATPPKEVAAPKKPIATPDIPNIAKELSNHRNTQWHSRSFTYRLYLGGQLNAEYSQDKNALTISADSSEANLDCNYSTKHGGLASVDDSKVSACNTLANELQSYLEQD